jgi:hypothetical protein
LISWHSLYQSSLALCLSDHPAGPGDCILALNTFWSKLGSSCSAIRRSCVA